MTLRKVILTLLLIAVALTSVSANNINTGGQLGVNRTISAYSLGQGSFFTGASFNGSYGKEYVWINKNGALSKESAQLLTQDVFFAIGATNWMDISVDLPFYQDIWDGKDENAGIGDLTVGFKLIHPGLRADAPFRVSYYMGFMFPTGSEDKGYFQRQSYYANETDYTVAKPFTSTGFNLTPMMLWTLDLRKLRRNIPLMFHGNFGFSTLMHTEDQNNYPVDNSAFVGGGAMEAFVKENVSIFLEMSGQLCLNKFKEGFTLGKINDDMLLLSLGTSIEGKKGLYGSIALDLGIGDDKEENRSNWDRLDLQYSTSPTTTVGVNVTLGYKHVGKNADPDFDRIPTSEDKCPYQAEDYDGYLDKDGCPDLVNATDTVTVVKNDTIIVSKTDTVRVAEKQEATKIVEYGVIALRSINFRTGSAVLTRSSYAPMDELAASLKKFPQVKLAVRGYTDKTGSKELNLKISQDRAQSVVNYLINKGISKKRLTAKGMGYADPISDNSTAEGRLLNRRVEIQRTDK